MTRFHRPLPVTAFALAGAILTPCAHANFVLNHSFEFYDASNGPGPGGNTGHPDNHIFSSIDYWPRFSGTQGFTVTWNPPATHLTGEDGQFVLNTPYLGVYQEFPGMSLIPGGKYTLTVAIGNINDSVEAAPDGSFRIELFAGGSGVNPGGGGGTSLGFFAGNAQTYAPSGGFLDATIVYVAPLIGAPSGDLRVEIWRTTAYDGSSVNIFDNVRLVPEPAIGLILPGLTMLARRRRAL